MLEMQPAGKINGQKVQCFKKIPGRISRSLVIGNKKYFFPVFIRCAFAVRL